MREKIRLDSGWRFHKGDITAPYPRSKGPVYIQAKTEHRRWGPAAYAYDDTPDSYNTPLINTEFWETVELPHDYIISQVPKEKYNNTLGYFEYQNAWYRKHFTLNPEDEGRRITLYFEGITGHATVYLNGAVMKRSFCGYTSFEVDISETAYYDRENVLAVYVDMSDHEGWWYEGAGLYRHVWLVKTERIAVDLWGVYVNPQKGENGWNTAIETTVLNRDAVQGEIEVTSALLDPAGREAAAATASLRVPAGEKAAITQNIFVDAPQLWDLESPCLYKIRTTLCQSGEEIDRVETTFGYRTIRFDPERGFFLNGRQVKIKGVCCHQDYGLTGKAIPDNVQRYRLQLMKEMGANGYRTAHYPHAEAVMDALDEMGFLVMDETRWFSASDEAKEQLTMLLKRDRNHPSVILWSVGNEEPCFTTQQGVRIFDTLKALVKRYDTTRPVLAAVDRQPLTAPVMPRMDVLGVNYNLESLEALHQKYPKIPFVHAENCATGSTRGWYFADSPIRGYIGAYDKDTNQWFLGREKTWRFLAEREWVCGGYQWAGIEHRGETVWPRLCSQSGAVDLYLQRKDAFYQNQSLWLEEPMLHLLPHWNHPGREGEIIEVWAYTNCEEAELFLNGESLGCQRLDRYAHAVWQVPYTPGVLTAVGRIGGLEAARDTAETSGPAAALQLRLENDVQEANGRDAAIFTCYCTDEQGRFVPDAAPVISFDCNGLGRLLGTGSDVCDHVPPCCPDRRMRAGLCSAAVQVGSEPGEMKLYASSPGLRGAALSVTLI